MECTEQLNLEAKLRELLARSQKQGWELVRSAERLADNISGSVPQPSDSATKAESHPGCAHELVSRIAATVGGVFDTLERELARSHSGLGDFSGPQPDTMNKPMTSTRPY